jgi:hypothetical protein
MNKKSIFHFLAFLTVAIMSASETDLITFYITGLLIAGAFILIGDKK